MMCLNTNALEFRAIEKLSGLSKSYLAYFCSKFLEQYDRWPRLDEIPGANSNNYLNKHLSVKDGFVEINNLLERTGTNSVEEALIVLNNTYLDQEITITPFYNTAKIDIRQRPTTTKLPVLVEHNFNIPEFLIFNGIINKLQLLYGINIHNVDSSYVSENIPVPGASIAKAFVYNGEIYVNTDLASKDAPVHEMMHILIGSLKNTPIYLELINSILTSELFPFYQRLYPKRTKNDVAEEAFVEEFAKLVTGETSLFGNLSDSVKYELMYHANRVLDTVLFGQRSVKVITEGKAFKLSLKLLCLWSGSTLFNKEHVVNTSKQHRQLMSIKRELLENNELEERCQ